MDPLVRAIKTLTIAVWCLCGLVGVQLALHGVGFLRSSRMIRNATAGTSEPTITTLSQGASASRPEARGSQFHNLSPENKVEQASAILLVSYQKEGARFKAVVAEVLKHDPDTALYYSVGDEMPELSYYPKDDETRGEGQVVFMVGTPAEMRSSYTFDRGRVGDMGDMPLEILRGMVKASKK